MDPLTAAVAGDLVPREFGLRLGPDVAIGNNRGAATVPRCRSTPPMLRIRITLLLCALFAVLASCDNVGRAFDPNVNPPNNGGPTPPSAVQVPPARGDLRDGRPVVRETYPKGGGWPGSVPIVVEFSESMNQSSIAPTTPAGTDGKVILRLEGTTQVLPTVYDFLAGGRLLVMRPISDLVSPSGTAFEVVLLPGARDTDGLAITGTAEQILATFTLDTAAPNEDGAILATYPRDNARDVPIDSEFIVVFTKSPNATPFLSAANFLVRTAAGVAVAGTPSAPLVPTDTRVVRFVPTATSGFAPGTGHELVVTAGITFGTAGVLRFSGRTPFLRFTTATVPQPISVTIANATAGFPNGINRSNVTNLQMAVALPAEALAGDRVVVRVYGSDRQTQIAGDLAFLERIVTVTSGGAQSVTADFSGALGSLANLRFEDGRISFAALIQRGTAHSGVVLGSTAVVQDSIAPTLSGLQMALGSNGTDLLVEQEDLVVLGTASEQVGDIHLTVGGNPIHVFASRANGAFLSLPVNLGRRVAPTAYSLSIFDRAGNEAPAPKVGNVIQRGLITGVGTTGNLTVEAYDAATLRALAGVTVLVDPGAPTIPASAQRQTGTTDADGHRLFTGLPVGTHTVTLIASGYDPITLYATSAGFVSLPLRPATASSAVATTAGVVTLDGTLADATTIFGSNLFDDPTVTSVKTSGAAPTVIPPTAIIPNRLQILTAFGGNFVPPSPQANPAFAFQVCNLLGGDLATPTPPAAPVAAGANATVALLARDRGTDWAVLPQLTVDFNQSLGLDTLSVTTSVRFMMALDGFSGQVLSGIGFALGQVGVGVSGTYSSGMLLGLEPFHPDLWVMTEAVDSLGSTCRTRARVDPVTGGATDAVTPQWIPRIAQPSGPFTGPPLVTVFDSLDTAQPELAFGALGVLDIVARDAAGHGWRMIVEDTDDRLTASDDYQFPDPGTAVPLANGTWTVLASARLFLRGGRSPGDFLLADRIREELTFARAPTQAFTVQ